MPQDASSRFAAAIFTFSDMESAIAGYKTCCNTHASFGHSMNEADLRLILDFERAKIAVTAKHHRAYEKSLHQGGFDVRTTFAICDDAFPELGPGHDPEGGREMRSAA